MTNVLVVTKRFYPPWSDGNVSYARGFVESALETAKRKNLDLSVLSLTDAIWFSRIHKDALKDYLSTNPIGLRWFHSTGRSATTDVLKPLKALLKDTSYQLIHIIYAGLDPLLARLIASRKNNTILKHLIMYPTGAAFPIQKSFYALLERSGILNASNIGFSVSNENLRRLYGLKKAFVIPPAVNTKLFKPCNSANSSNNEAFEILNRAEVRFGDPRTVLSRDIIILYIGPLIQDRFGSKSILNALSRLKNDFSLDIGLVVVGRGFEGLSFLQETRRIVEKNSLGGRVYVCLKPLSDREKVCLLNQSSIFLYLFQNLRSMSVIFPPIAILESMSAGNAVVTGGLPYLNTLINDSENGILIDNVADDKIVARGIWNALTQMRKITHNARTKIETEFSTVQVSEAYSKLLESCGACD